MTKKIDIALIKTNFDYCPHSGDIFLKGSLAPIRSLWFPTKLKNPGYRVQSPRCRIDMRAEVLAVMLGFGVSNLKFRVWHLNGNVRDNRRANLAYSYADKANTLAPYVVAGEDSDLLREKVMRLHKSGRFFFLSRHSRGYAVRTVRQGERAWRYFQPLPCRGEYMRRPSRANKKALEIMDASVPLRALRLAPGVPIAYWVEHLLGSRYAINTYLFYANGRVTRSKVCGTILDSFTIARREYFLDPNTLRLHEARFFPPPVSAEEAADMRAQVTKPFTTRSLPTSALGIRNARGIRTQAPEGFKTLILAGVHYKLVPPPAENNLLNHTHAVRLVGSNGKEYLRYFTDALCLPSGCYVINAEDELVPAPRESKFKLFTGIKIISPILGFVVYNLHNI